MTSKHGRIAAVVLGLVLGSDPALAGDFDFLDFSGSFGAAGGFHRYVPAISNPLFNETPYITTELRALYLHNDIPTGFVSSGGDIDAVAAEARIALTDRLGFIAPKDGYVQAHFTKGLKDTDGFENIALGLKYAVISDPADDAILTVGGLYEPPTGSLDTTGITLQGRGGGFFNPFISGAKSWGRFGVEGDVGVNVALDSNHDSSMVHYAGHVDYELIDNLYGLFEMNGFSVYQTALRTAGNFEGVDLVNFGSLNAGTVITAAFGLRYRVNDHVLLGAAYERPVTNREDIISQRVYVDLILKY